MGNKIVEGLAAISHSSEEVAEDILLLKFTVVNVCIIGNPDITPLHWVLVDTGLENSADFILKSAEKRFGKGSRPEAIILTHGHFDHIGSVAKLSDFWDVPVYISALEMPYVTGKKNYPEADPSVDEGLIAKLSPTFPHSSIDLEFRAVTLPSDGSVPGINGWRWIHTPGHTEGHISLFRDADRILIAGDAFSTVKQESLGSVISQNEKISGPPKYLTTDWKAAEASVKKLMSLNPSLAIPSHGQPMKGSELQKHLKMLADNFNRIAVPRQGRFVDKQ